MLDFLFPSKKPFGIENFQLECISEYFFFVQDLTVRFVDVHFFRGIKKVSVLTKCPIYSVRFMERILCEFISPDLNILSVLARCTL